MMHFNRMLMILKMGLDEQCEATSTKTHAIQGESEDNITPDEGTPNVTDSTTAVQQTTTRCSRPDVRRFKYPQDDIAHTSFDVAH